MKKLMFALIMVMLVCSAASAEDFNARGSALVPAVRARYYSSTSHQSTSFYISNVTSSTVTCRVSVYAHNGDDITSQGNVYTAGGDGGSLVLVDSGTGTFELPANSTRAYMIQQPDLAGIIGYAVIEWTSDDSVLRKALLAGAVAHVCVGTEKSTYFTSINGGDAF